MAAFLVRVPKNKLSEMQFVFPGLFLKGIQSGSQEVLAHGKFFSHHISTFSKITVLGLPNTEFLKAAQKDPMHACTYSH